MGRFRVIYNDIIMVEKEREFFQESVGSKIENAMNVFELIDKYEDFKNTRDFEKD